MKGFELTKLIGAVVLAMLVAMVSGFIAREVVDPKMPEKASFIIEGVGVSQAVAAEDQAPKGPAPIEPLLANANAEAGQKYARVCAACHDFTKGGPNKIGPNLYNVVNGPHAHAEGFAYSEGMKSLHDKKWDYATLNEFLYKPSAVVKGTKMTYAGIKNDSDRANVIAWLRSLSDSPAPLPTK